MSFFDNFAYSAYKNNRDLTVKEKSLILDKIFLRLVVIIILD